MQAFLIVDGHAHDRGGERPALLSRPGLQHVGLLAVAVQGHDLGAGRSGEPLLEGALQAAQADRVAGLVGARDTGGDVVPDGTGHLADSGVRGAVIEALEVRRLLSAAVDFELITDLTPEGASLQFGTGMAAQGSEVLVGNPSHVEGGVANVGEAYLFETATGDRMRIANPTDPGSRPGNGAEQFGHRVAFGEDYLLIGTRHAQSGHGGSAHLFEVVDGEAQHLATLTNPHAGSDWFGSNVAAFDAEHVLVMAEVDPTLPGQGSVVHLIHWQSHTVVASLSDPTAGSADGFGVSIAVSGNQILIGAPTAAGGGAGRISDELDRDAADGRRRGLHTVGVCLEPCGRI